MARYREVRFWTPESVRKTCIDNGLFTRGGNEEYAYVLNCIHHFKPTLENIEAVARMILQYSDCNTISNIMTLLINHAVTTYIELNDEEDDHYGTIRYS